MWAQSKGHKDLVELFDSYDRELALAVHSASAPYSFGHDSTWSRHVGAGPGATGSLSLQGMPTAYPMHGGYHEPSQDSYGGAHSAYAGGHGGYGGGSNSSFYYHTSASDSGTGDGRWHGGGAH